MSFPFGVMIPVLRKVTEDRYGDGEFSTHHQVGPCGVSFRVGEEVTDRREASIADATVYAPTGSDVLASDQLVIGGENYRVVGVPQRNFPHPMTGYQWSNSVVIHVSRATG